MFSVSEHGVFYKTKDDELQWICSHLKIAALVRDKGSENWGRLLEFKDADGTVHRWAMPMEMLSGGGELLRAELLRLGLQIASGAAARNRLAEYITTIKTTKRARCVNRTGWYGGAFVLPERTIGGASEQVIYQAESSARDYRQAGTLEQWRAEVAALCAGNSRLVLSVSVAFAAMLLNASGAESGGLNLVGESSTGKTTALKVAASVYGAPDYAKRWRATTNGLEGLAALHSDTLLILDELAQCDPREAGENAYMLANGGGKTRAGRTGAARKCSEWRLLFLSNGEIGLAQHMRDGGKKAKAGQEIRLLDIPSDAGAGLGLFNKLHDHVSGAALSKALIEGAAQYYGTAAIAFLESVTEAENLAALPDTIKQLTAQFVADNLPADASGQAHRVCARFALIAAAGELATYYGITGWQPGEAERAAVTCFKAWLEQRGGAGNQERAAILGSVKAFFETHGDARFTDFSAPDNSRTINRAGFRKTDNGAMRFYVLPESFKNEVCAGFDMRTVARVLIEAGWLEPDSEGKSSVRECLPDIGRTRCYKFTSAMWDA
ncbi:MAG: DUF927 domain-containing protein [Pseudomonadota bacterium]|nr:DUF927 domain-containing protein [Pseudomonadota bacterium]